MFTRDSSRSAIRWGAVALIAFWSSSFPVEDLSAADHLAAIIIDPARPSAYWLAAAAGSRLPIVPEGGLPTLPAGNAGWLEFKFFNPLPGWRRLDLLGRPHLGQVELEIDVQPAVSQKEMPRPGSLRPNDWVWLPPGVHRLRVITNNWTGLPQVTSIRLEAPKAASAGGFRLLLSDYKAVSAIGKCQPVQVLAGGGSVPSRVNVVFSMDGHFLQKNTIDIAPSPEPEIKSIDVPCDRAGDVNARFVSESPERETAEAQASYTVFNVEPIDTVFQRGKVVAEIDAVAQLPDFASGTTGITQGPAGVYRESSEFGTTRYIRHESAVEPSWFAYRVTGLNPGSSYLFEIEYPDDDSRVFVAAFRDSKGATSYPISIGAETGGVWPVGSHMARRSAIIWPVSSDGRIIIYNIHDHQRAAISRIRFFEIVAADLHRSHDGQETGRDVAIWSEEGTSFRSVVGKGTDASSIYTAVERYMSLANSIKATTVVPTVVIYNYQLYPSRYNLMFTERGSDVTAALLLGAQHHGLKLIPELHPRGDELLWTARTENELKQRLLASASTPTYKDSDGPANRPRFFNALDADVRGWYRDMVGELADRYKDYSAFNGIQLRVSNWQNPALNNFVSLDFGYESQTVSRFFRDTKLIIPDDMLLNQDTPNAVRNRHDVILANFREAWVKWRCEQIRDVFRDIVRRVRQARSDLIVQIHVFALSGERQEDSKNLIEAGVDLQMLKGVEGLVIVDGRFQHGAKEASTEWQLRTRDGPLGSSGVRVAGDEATRPSTLSPMQYIEITGAVATSEQLGWGANSKEPWVSASSEPPGRLQLARYAELVGLFDVYMLGDGGNGYVFSGDGLREFMTEFRMLPRRPFARLQNVPDPIILRYNDKHFYVVNLSSDPQSISIDVNGVGRVHRITSGEAVLVRDDTLSLELKPYELIVFQADKQVGNMIVSLR